MQISKNIRSTNFAVSDMMRKIEYIILHYTEQDFNTSVESLCSEEKGVSAHYLVAEDGGIFNLVDDENIAWHAGKSYWRGYEALNNNSIGIEIVNLGDRSFPETQMDSVIELCKFLKKKYDIPRENIIGHSDIAPDRKIDPGIFFDWRRLSDEGLGIELSNAPMHPLGCHTPPKGHALNDIRVQYDIEKIQTNLAKIGYKIAITGKLDKQTSDVIRAFKSHFCPEIIHEFHTIEYYNNFDSIYDWGESENIVLTNLLITIEAKI